MSQSPRVTEYRRRGVEDERTAPVSEVVPLPRPRAVTPPPPLRMVPRKEPKPLEKCPYEVVSFRVMGLLSLVSCGGMQRWYVGDIPCCVMHFFTGGCCCAGTVFDMMNSQTIVRTRSILWYVKRGLLPPKELIDAEIKRSSKRKIHFQQPLQMPLPDREYAPSVRPLPPPRQAPPRGVLGPRDPLFNPHPGAYPEPVATYIPTCPAASPPKTTVFTSTVASSGSNTHGKPSEGSGGGRAPAGVPISSPSSARKHPRGPRRGFGPEDASNPRSPKMAGVGLASPKLPQGVPSPLRMKMPDALAALQPEAGMPGMHRDSAENTASFRPPKSYGEVPLKRRLKEGILSAALPSPSGTPSSSKSVELPDTTTPSPQKHTPLPLRMGRTIVSPIASSEDRFLNPSPPR